MSLLSSTKESGCVLVFDIGNGSVGGAIVLPAKEHPPTILYSFRVDIPFQEQTDGSRLLSLMLQKLSEVVSAIVHEGFAQAGLGGQPPSTLEAVVSLSAPWIISKTSFLRLSSKAPTLVTPAVFSTLLRQSDEENRSELEREVAGTVKIEQKLIKSTLNGYDTPRPYGKEANEIEFTLFGSFSLPVVIDRIRDVITREVQCKAIGFHSFSLLSFAVLRELFPREEDFIVIDISGEQTELSIVKKAIVAETATFPFGKNHLKRMLTKELGVPAATAETFFMLHGENKGTGGLFGRASGLITIAEGVWQREFAAALRLFSSEMLPPRTLYMTSDEDVSPIFRHSIESGNFTAFLPTSTSFRVITVDNALLAGAVAWSPSIRHDPFLGLTAAFANRLSQ